MTSGLSSSKGVLALLRESDPDVLRFALKRLVQLVDTYWYEISSDLPLIEELHESSDLEKNTQMLAALVASQVYFHLGAYSESVHFALAAGSAFNYTERSIYTDTILSCCIDQFVHYQEQPEETRGELDPRLEDLFTALTNKWILQEDTPVKELVGFTIRARRIDFLEKVLRQHIAATKSAVILNFTFDVANVLLRDIVFRRKILRLLVDLYAQEDLSTIDYFSRAQCLLFLGDSQSTANLMNSLIYAGDKATAYQLAFDLYEYGNQEFLTAVSMEISNMGEKAVELQSTTGGDTTSTSLEIKQEEVSKVEVGTVGKKYSVVHKNILLILAGGTSTTFYYKFLYTHCNADIHVLNRIKQSIDSKKAVPHNATVIAHALMYCGTTIDAFLRGNMEWLGRANYWAKFIVTASIGVIHRGHITDSLALVDQYLPNNNMGPLPYQEAGALYALGLIHAPVGVACNRKTIEFLKDTMRKYSASEQIIHGASLGIGLAAMGLKDESLYDSLFTCVSGCDAVGSEGAALGIGLVMMGSGNLQAIQDMRALASEDNQKEKTIRGISMAMALMMLGREDECWTLANELLDNSDPWVRLGGCFMLGLGYAGAENSKVIERLLSVTVKDTSDDVRRNAATMIGFLTIKDPVLCLELVRVLVDSYNPHIRYGVGMALAVSAAGTGNAEVIEVLWGLTEDLVDFVRQGAYIALAIVMVQVTEAENPKVKELRDNYFKRISGRKEDMCSKFGCIIASGILDAGGRNCTFALHRQRHRLDKAVVGMFVFLQYWYWFPYILMISLSMQPTCFIGLNDKLELPEYSFKSNAPPSRFALPKSILAEKKEAKATSVKAVVLSTTKKEEQFNRLKRMSTACKAGETESSNKTQPKTEKTEKAASAAAAETATATTAAAPAATETTTTTTTVKEEGGNTTEVAQKETEVEKKEEPEPNMVILTNPSRVTARQLAVVSHDYDNRFVPLKPNPYGVCLLRDTKPTEGSQRIITDLGWNCGDEAPPPEPFAWP
ncbi:putative proteasome regulatory non-ATPase subunit 2 [Trypanosoma theileri]|uniref:Putative proteasome regulatory non-ATPase subunit 2 n=1 Tax=Trypanosoma theileri TaxID=67003 RepID=A0A1X0NQV9_9TRYP|nr:putative proteasome regulatory non-ATPase subunit 2 [Trypanosoma theileri]ORC87105.1 putative proteasome regulatory non-ATPase subunit 2 [Trypanosoma theileri]